MSNSKTAQIADHYLSSTRHSVTRQIWQFRELLLSLISRDLKVKYQRSALGLLWTLLNPLLLVLIFVVVFSYVLRIQIDGYWAFLISGIFSWEYISTSMNRATFVLRGHAPLRRSVAFPNVIIILGNLLALLLEFMVEIMIVVAIICIFYHQFVPVSVVLLPLLIFLQFLIAAGLMFALSVVSILFDDVEHAMPAILRLLFFATPVMYPVSMIPESLRIYAYLNPFAGLMELYHAILYQGVFPSWQLLGAVSAAALAIFYIGFWIFHLFEDVCVEIA